MLDWREAGDGHKRITHYFAVGHGRRWEVILNEDGTADLHWSGHTGRMAYPAMAECCSPAEAKEMAGELERVLNMFDRVHQNT